MNKSAFVPWTIGELNVTTCGLLICDGFVGANSCRLVGKRNCLGKNLSLMEIRVAAALTLSEFDVEMVPGQESKLFTLATDYFTTTPGPFNVVLKSRKTT